MICLQTGEGFVGVNPYPRSLIDRFRLAYRNAFDRWLMVWMMFVAAIFVSASIVVPRGIHTLSPVMLTAMYMLSIFAGFSAGVLGFALFALCREVRHFLSSMAFFALGAGVLLQGITDLRDPVPISCDWIMSSAWLVAAVLFVGTAFSESIWRPMSRRQALVQLLLAAIAILAFPLGLLPYVLDTHLITSFVSNSGSLVLSLIRIAFDLVTMVLLVLALRGYYRQFRARDDAMAALMCYFLIPCALAFLAHSASSQRFDEWWIVSQILMSGAWIVAAVGAGVENAFAQREIRERFHELEMLRDVSWSLVGSHSTNDLLNRFSLTLIDRFGAKIAAIYLADDDRKSVRLAALCGPENVTAPLGTNYAVESTDRRPGFHTGHTAKALKTGQMQIAENVFVDVEFVPWRIIAEDDGCAVSVPLVGPDGSFGVINAYFADSEFITNQRLKLLATLVAAATPAIHNAIFRQHTSGDETTNDIIDMAA